MKTKMDESGKAMNEHTDETAEAVEKHNEEAAEAREEHAKAAADAVTPPKNEKEAQKEMQEAGAGPNANDPEAQAASKKALEHAKKSEEAQEKKDGAVEKVTGVDPEEHHEKAENAVQDEHKDAMTEAGKGPNHKDPEARAAADEALEHAEKSEKAQAKKDGVVEKTEGHVDETVDQHVNEDPLGEMVGSTAKTVDKSAEKTMDEASNGPEHKDKEAREATKDALQHAEKSEEAQEKKDGLVEKTTGVDPEEHHEKVEEHHENVMDGVERGAGEAAEAAVKAPAEAAAEE